MTQVTDERLIARLDRVACGLETCSVDPKVGYVTMPLTSARLLAKDFRDAIAALTPKEGSKL